jgi:hypothetical protein
MRLIKCTTSFLIGFYISFLVMMIVSAYVITTEFVSKTSLKTKLVYIDGRVYEVKEQR